MFERSDLTDQFLYRGLDCCGPTSGPPGKRYCECEAVKKWRRAVFGFVADVNVWDDRDRSIPYRCQMFGGMHHG
jgi:hypothetical protein